MHETNEWAAVQEHARELAGAIERAIMRKGADVTATGQRLHEHAVEKWDEARVVARDQAHEADAYAREHVWVTAAIAAAVGAVLGVVFGRRR
jgi:ElaB/YqjD/DUF883 family membrane-anchored ribosome-binding protein